jgi:prepilin-type N-terminal cleavage/methylation domain-containing protein/prepilin-type processing-associated H-X9-DG protein
LVSQRGDKADEVERKMGRRTAFAFTLIELLVVMAVIAVVAAILFPVFAQAREKSREAVCLSNLRQMGMAGLLYAQDYDQTLLWNPPPGGKPGNFWTAAHHESDCPHQPTTSYVMLLQPYLKSHAVLKCPSFPGYPLATFQGYAGSLDPVLDRQVGYGYNLVLEGDLCRPQVLSAMKSSASQVALFADGFSLWAKNCVYILNEERYWAMNERLPPRSPALQALSPEVGEPRHHGGLNFVFADGHARFDRPVVVYQGPVYRSGFYPRAMMD